MNIKSNSALVKDSILMRFWLTLIIIILFQIIIFFTVKIIILTFLVYILISILFAILINIIDWYFKYFVVKKSTRFYKSYIWYWLVPKWFQNVPIGINYFIKLKQEKWFYKQIFDIFVITYLTPVLLFLDYHFINKIFVLIIATLFLLYIINFVLVWNTKNNSYLKQYVNSIYRISNLDNIVKFKTKQILFWKLIMWLPLFCGYCFAISYFIIFYINFWTLLDYPLQELIPVNFNNKPIFFASYNFVHLLLSIIGSFITLIWLMQINLSFMIDLETFVKNQTRILIQCICLINLFAIFIML